jgi:hypothetical protein
MLYTKRNYQNVEWLKILQTDSNNFKKHPHHPPQEVRKNLPLHSLAFGEGVDFPLWLSSCFHFDTIFLAYPSSGNSTSPPENVSSLATSSLFVGMLSKIPLSDAAKSMVQKFKAIQEQAKKSEETPKPVSRKVSQFYYAKLQFSCTIRRLDILDTVLYLVVCFWSMCTKIALTTARPDITV